jgi:hypothetical protein
MYIFSTPAACELVRNARTSAGFTQAANNALNLSLGWFTEGFDTFDLKEAKALIDAPKAVTG